MNYLELTAVLATLACVVLTLRRNVYSWPIGLVGVTAYAFVFHGAKLYADFALQMLFFIQGVWGWYQWKSHTQNRKETIVTVEKMSFAEKAITWGAFGILYQIVVAVLIDCTDASVPYVDAFVSTWSLIATYWTAKRKIESWYMWIAVDAVCIALFAYKGLAMSSVLYIVLFTMANFGLQEWQKHVPDDEIVTE
jgi:nicotinamide mononucleotide transporter